ncbi:MAG TPA: N-acetylmuramoyl-L-alanine amidase [Terriglobia bacterium]|nr:N-acetylmuramoyl-L-alanine amidase [Terriglobia bacterium]
MTQLIHPLRRHSRVLFILMPILGLALMFWPARTLRSDNFVFYLPDASHVLPLQTIGSASYLPLLQVLNTVGRVQGLTVAKDSLKVWFNDSQIELRQDNKRVRFNKEKINLSEPVRVQSGQFMVPLNFLETVLPRLIHESVVYRLGSRRIFIGDVKPGTFSFRLDQVPNGSRLTLEFSDKIKIRTASSNGKWVLYLGNKPVQPLEQKFNFQDPYLSNIQFDDQDGVPKLILTPTVDGLNFYPKIDDTGKIVTAELLKAQAAVAQQPAPPPPPQAPGAGTPSAVAPAPPETAASAGGLGLPMVVLDAGHGGDDSGARGGNGLLEKDLMAQLVARVRSTLLASGKYRVVLTRVGDVNLTLDQRAATANAARAKVFVTFHAGNLGVHTSRIVVYTLEAPSWPPSAGDAQVSGLFIPWGTVQLSQLRRSQQLARILQKEFTAISGATVSPPATAPLRELRSVNAAAVAVEIGSLAAEVDSTALTNSNFQAGIANAIVRALDEYEGGPS